MQGMEDRKLSSQPGRVQTPIGTGRKDETGIHTQGRKGVRRTHLPPPLPFLTPPRSLCVPPAGDREKARMSFQNPNNRESPGSAPWECT